MEEHNDEFKYPVVTTCQWKGRVWTQGEVFVTDDPADIPPHHFAGGINPKNTEAVKAELVKRGVLTVGPPAAASQSGEQQESPPASTEGGAPESPPASTETPNTTGRGSNRKG